MSTAGGLAGRGGADEAGGVQRPDVLGSTGGRVWRSKGSGAAGGAGAGGAWGESNRAGVYGGSVGRIPVWGAASRRLCQPGGEPASGRRVGTARCVCDGDRAVRAAVEPAVGRGACGMPAVAGSGAGLVVAGTGDGGAGWGGVAAVAAGVSEARVGGATASAEVWARGGSGGGEVDAVGVVPPKPAEHVYGATDAADVGCGSGTSARGRRGFSLRRWCSG